jgi:hypothetical protein
MMTLNELQTANINPLIVREAYDQATQRLADTLNTKTAFEQKAFTLFGGYLTISLALFGAGSAVYNSRELQHLVLPFWIAGIMFVAGASFFMLALKDKVYGALASHPSMWLNPGTIDGPDTVLPTMLAYITFYHQARIDTSEAMNLEKARWIRFGIYVGLAAPFIFMAIVVIL